MATELTYFDIFLKFGLFLGGVFQLICILAIIFVPSSYLRTMENNNADESKFCKEHQQQQHQSTSSFSKQRKSEKVKKRR